MDRAAKIRIGTAAAKALAWWLVVYVALAHCFVVWKWQTPPISTVATTTATASASADASTATDATELLPRLQQQIQQLDELTARLQVAVNHSRQRNAAMEQQLKALARLASSAQEVVDAETAASNKNNNSNESDDVDNDSASTEKLRQLLGLSNFSELTSAAAVSEIFVMATAELEQLVVTQNWEAAIGIFEPDYPLRTTPDFLTTISTCSGKSVSQSQLEYAKRQVEEVFVSQRTETVPVSFPETLTRLQQALTAAVSEAVAEITAKTTSTASSHYDSDESSDCLKSADQVLPWMEAGLDAIHHNKDVRSALLRAWEATSVDSSKLILDADLSQAPRRKEPIVPNRVNLRNLIDTPTLHESSMVVDWLLDWVSGKHDGLDDFLDKYVYASVPDDKAVGKEAVARLLQAAGKVDIPIPPVLHITKAGALLR